MFFQRTGPQILTRQLGLSIFLLLLFCGTDLQAGEPNPDIEVFVRTGCPHCEAAIVFLKELERERPAVRIAIYDVAEDSATRLRLATLAAEKGIADIGVPTFLIGSELIVGFLSAETTGTEIRARLDRLAQGAIPSAAIILVSGVVYFAFMAAWLNMFLLIGVSRPIQIGLGTIAFLVGAVNVKDFFAMRQGISFSIPESAKPRLYDRIRRILQADNLAGALTGIVILAGLVNLIELLCTAGFPALYTQILTL